MARFPADRRAAGLALLLLAACGDEPARVEPAGRPNLLLIAVDTLRPDRLGAYGHPLPTSPHLDALAAESFVFERAQSVSPWTAPALISLMTGLYPDVHQVRDYPEPARMSTDVTTLAEILGERGYRNAAITGGGYAKGDFGLDQGFHEYLRQEGDDDSNASNLVFPSRLAANIERSVAWLEKHAGAPFFLFFHTYEPHYPYHPEPEDLAAVARNWDPAAEREELTAALVRWNDGRRLSSAQWMQVARHRYHCELACAGLPAARREQLDAALETRGLYYPVDMSSALVAFIRELYDAEVRYADRQLQRLLDALERLGVSETTIVVVVSDHGESLGEHGEVGHGLLLSEVVLRIVLMLRAPHLDLAPRRLDEVVSQVDLLPTLVELMGGDPGAWPSQGRSLVPLMRGEELEWPVFSHANSGVPVRGHFYSVREGRWRWVAQRDGAGRWLFDLVGDPGESADVKAAHPEVAARMEALLREQRAADERLRARYGAPSAPRLDPATRRDLEGLGYVGEDDGR